jgi:hypothetical protein
MRVVNASKFQLRKMPAVTEDRTIWSDKELATSQDTLVGNTLYPIYRNPYPHLKHSTLRELVLRPTWTVGGGVGVGSFTKIMHVVSCSSPSPGSHPASPGHSSGAGALWQSGLRPLRHRLHDAARQPSREQSGDLGWRQRALAAQVRPGAHQNLDAFGKRLRPDRAPCRRLVAKLVA